MHADTTRFGSFGGNVRGKRLVRWLLAALAWGAPAAAIENGAPGTGAESTLSKGEYTDCRPATTPLVFDGGYQVSLCYETADGVVGEGKGGIWASGQSGLLWFFDRGNAEVLVKILNGCSHNGRRWIFVAPVTDVAFNLHVTSSAGREWIHRNRLGVTAATQSDTSTFVCDADDADAISSTGSRAATVAGRTTNPSPISEGEYTDCLPAMTPLVFDGGYQVSLCYETAEGTIGEGRGGIWTSGQSGLLWFFDRGNAEVLVKVLNGCSHNGHRWIYVAPVTDLAFNLHITSSGGRRWTHRNRLGETAASRSDTSTFVCATDDGKETVTVTPETVEFTALGQTAQLAAEVRDPAGRVTTGVAVTWASGDSTVATVDGSGLVTAVGNGATTITATAGEATDDARATVMQTAGSVVVSPPADVIAPGDTLHLTAEAFDENGHRVEGAVFSWSSSDASVATVDGSGLVQAVAEGMATITAAVGDAYGTFELTVENPDRAALVALVVVSPPADGIAPGDTLHLTAEAFDENGHRVEGAVFSWSSSDTSVATVDGSGLVQAVGEGTATITAAVGDAYGTFELTVENPDRAALAALYEATNGPNWLNSDNWVTEVPLDEWYGVDTNASGRVVGLDLASRWDLEARELLPQGLAGPIPPQLGDLTNLQTLNLSYNNLTGPMPPELGKLANLWQLHLYENKLTGPMPPELGKLANLRSLSLAYNNLTGPIPPELGDLASLETLYLYHNTLTRPIPQELGKLANLEELRLSHNDLSGPIPQELGKLANLRSLSLFSNNLTGPLPPELGDLASLERLSLSYNNLTGPIPEELGKLANLDGLDLGHNQLTELQPGVFVGLTNLTSLYLAGNPGAPFTLTLQPLRLDNEDLLAPGPATVAVGLPEGAPFPIQVPLLVQGAEASADTLTIAAGTAQSTQATLTRAAAAAAGARVTLGPVAAVPQSIRGIAIAVGDPITVFAALSPTVSFNSAAESAPEGGSVVLEVALSTPASAPVTFTYRVGPDDDPGTANADASDHAHGTSGSVHIAADVSSATIEIAINDDGDIEPAREVFTVMLDVPGEATGYVRGYPNAANVIIEEGVCDRTPRIRDEIMAATGTDDCAGTDDEALASILRLDIRDEAALERSEGHVLWTRDLVARLRSGECDMRSLATGPAAPTNFEPCGDAAQPTMQHGSRARSYLKQRFHHDPARRRLRGSVEPGNVVLAASGPDGTATGRLRRPSETGLAIAAVQ